MTRSRTRLILCVDGVSSHTTSGASQGTNVHRLYASIQRGICTDSVSGEAFDQDVQYLPWPEDIVSKGGIHIGTSDQSYVKRIEEVYDRCSRLLPEKDEVWLFGFGRGANVVRAVAGLLHNFGAMASAGQAEFGRDFKRMLKEMRNVHNSSLASPFSVPSSTRPAARIQFIGVFDPIKCKNDDIFDTSFNRSIRNMRQALALHEDKESLSPALLFPAYLDDLALKDYGRTFQQAYFVGRHNDIGGTAKKCGLALYPCQWIWLEATKCGLAVSVTDQSSAGYDLLFALLPEPARGERTHKTKLWSFASDNGITMQMPDFRSIHRTSGVQGSKYAVRLTSPWLGSVGGKTQRSSFAKDGHLRGYCGWAPQGTIIHASVYLLLDEYIHVALETKDSNLQRNIETWRAKMMHNSGSIGANTGFWMDEEDDDSGSADPGALRVLVCGNTGVGKSSLINKTFGVDVTQSSHRTRGIHDVREEITWESRPDLIVHDSGGFEAGTDDEFLAIEMFLKERSAAETLLARVHVIWFCIDMNSPRTLQTATEKLFSAVSKYAKDVPVIIVATKKDQLLDIEFGAKRKMLKKEGRPFDEEVCESYANQMQTQRLDLVRDEMQNVPGGRLDACLAVSLDDDDSIAELTGATSHCFDTDRVRLLYIRAQSTRIDLKVDMAQAEIIKRYKRLVRQSATTLMLLGATVTRKVSHAQLTKSIMRCFGVPNVTAESAMEVFKANLWSTTASNVQLALAEAFQLIGLSCTGLTLGSPIWLVTGGINAAHVVPTTCRLFLIMACDMTWVLAHSFKEMELRTGTQPDESGIRAAAYDYTAQGHAQRVRQAIKALIPRKDVFASFRTEQVKLTLETLFDECKDGLKRGTGLMPNARCTRTERTSSDDKDMGAHDDIFANAQEATAALAELEAYDRPVVPELDGTGAIFELPAREKVIEQKRSDSAPKVTELEALNRF